MSRSAVEAGVVDPVAEHEAGALVMARHEDHEPDDHQHAKHVPSDRDVVEDRQQPVGEDVHDRVADQDDQEQQPGLVQDRLRVGRREVDPDHVHAVQAEHGLKEERSAVADAGHDPDQTDDVEPAGDPAPPWARELC